MWCSRRQPFGVCANTFKDAHITYVVEPAAAPVVAANPHINDVIVTPGRRGMAGFRDDLALIRRLRAARYDTAIDFHGGPRSSLVTWLSGAPVRVGYDVPGRGWMYTIRVAAAPPHPAATCRREPVGSPQRDRHPDARCRPRSGRDAGRPARRGRGRRASGARGRPRRRSRDRRARERGQSVPPLAARRLHEARRDARAGRPRPPRGRDVRTLGARGRRPTSSNRRGRCSSRLMPVACSRAASSRSTSSARSWTGRRSSSAATADRCTSPRRARSRSSACTGPRCQCARRPGERRSGSAKRSEVRRPAVPPVRSADMRRATSGASRGFGPSRSSAPPNAPSPARVSSVPAHVASGSAALCRNGFSGRPGPD